MYNAVSIEGLIPISNALGIPKINRHIFLCAGQSDAHSATPAALKQIIESHLLRGVPVEEYRLQ